MSTAPEPPAWIRWPVRVLAVVVVLPFRLAWELLTAIGRFLARWVGRPVAWLWHHLVVVPLSFVWRVLIVAPLSWMWRRLVVAPLSWLAHWLIVVPLRWLWQRRGWVVRPLVLLLRYLFVVPVVWFFEVTAPLWHALGRALMWTLETLIGAVVAVARWVHRWVLLPGWRGAGWLLTRCYRWLLRPVGVAVAWVWGRTVMPVWRLITGTGRWLRDAVVRPGATMAREVLVAVGLRR